MKWLLVLLGAACLHSAVTFAAQGYQVVAVCSLAPVDQVKKLAPWIPALDQMKPDEEAIGTRGSSCNYPTVHVQVIAFRQDTIDSIRKLHELEPVTGVGDAAWMYDQRGDYAVLLARVGVHLLTVQLDIASDKTFETAKPAAVELGRLFAATLR